MKFELKEFMTVWEASDSMPQVLTSLKLEDTKNNRISVNNYAAKLRKMEVPLKYFGGKGRKAAPINQKEAQQLLADIRGKSIRDIQTEGRKVLQEIEATGKKILAGKNKKD